MEKEFSTFKKIKMLTIALLVFVAIFIFTKLTLNYFEVSSETKVTTTFFFAIYGLLTVVIATIDLSRSVSLKAFKMLHYFSLGIVFSSLINLAMLFFYQSSLYSVNCWASLIGGLYLFFFWCISHQGVDDI